MFRQHQGATRFSWCTHKLTHACLTALLSFTAVAAHAWLSSDKLETIPPVPIGGQPATLRVSQLLSGPTIVVDAVEFVVSGQVVEVTALLTHGSTGPFPAPYSFQKEMPSLQPGVYEIRYSVRRRYSVSDPHSEALFQVAKEIVVAQTDQLKLSVEYYAAARDTYFRTIDENEIAALDSGVFVGWVRTGVNFPAYHPSTPDGTALVDVCRYYGKPEAGLGTHFFSAFVTECEAVAQLWPDKWILETSRAFLVGPVALGGSCPSGTGPIYRLYSNRPAVNHRYVTTLELREQMIGQGWVSEGQGVNGVGFCVPNSL